MSKEKREITCRSYLDGKLVREWKETRTVYVRKDGTEHINYMGGKMPLVAGVAEYHARQLFTSFWGGKP